MYLKTVKTGDFLLEEDYPVDIQQIYELSYQDDCLSYFDVCTAVPEMVKSGHLKEMEETGFVITENGCSQRAPRDARRDKRR